MKIITRLPYRIDYSAVVVRGQTVRVKPYQIIVWVSIGFHGDQIWDPRTPALPAILDPGNNHNFAIFQSQLFQWAGFRPEALRQLSTIRERGVRLPLHAARLWLHGNVPGTRERSQRDPHPLIVEGGIAIYPDGGQRLPHLPLLGLRALSDNQLRILIDGERREVTVRTARPRWWPFG